MKIVNRNALAVIPQKPFWDWLLSVDEQFDLEEIEESGDFNVYLIPEFENEDEIVEYLEKNFDQIFQNELLDWYSDESLWPTERTWDIFEEWFSIEAHSLVYDMPNSPLQKL